MTPNKSFKLALQDAENESIENLEAAFDILDRISRGEKVVARTINEEKEMEEQNVTRY